MNKDDKAYKIIEIANTHGGDIQYVLELIKQFEGFNKGYGMKFQPLHPDKLSTKDFSSYAVYQELLFSSKQWKSILEKASKTKDVWLDIFDEYGVQILKENHSKIIGIKLQVSVLFNYAVLKELSKVDLSKKKLILNIAALELDEIDYFLKKYESSLNPKEILLEVGFQGYPTELRDSGLSKISIVKKRFLKRVVFADHIDKESEYAIWMPLIAINAGADVIEKHVLLDKRETKYDAYSSLNFSQFMQMDEILNNFHGLLTAEFINDRERKYLENSIMKPILKIPKSTGQLVSIEEDFNFKRSGKDGLNSKKIKELTLDHHILAKPKKKGDTIQLTDFKNANIAVIIACRLKSSRLKAKALLKIGNLTSVEFCIKSACKFKGVNDIILATSNLKADQDLINYTYNDKVIFHRGDPDDVIQRYLDIIRKKNIDVVVRVTADNPFIDNEIFQMLLKSHFEKGADYTSAKLAAVGTNLEIINSQALEVVKTYFPKANYSEYMTWYFMNNQDHFKINLVELPIDLVRDYRLTLDYDDDLTLFNIINDNFINKPDYGIRDIFKFLDENKKLAEQNIHINPKYKTDQELIDTLNKETKIRI